MCSRRAQAAVECSGTARPQRKAQAAVEMLAYAAFFFMVFVAAIAVFLQVHGTELARAESAYAQEVAYGFADAVHVAFVAGPGFSGSAIVPPNILGKRYMLYMSASPHAESRETGLIYVEWESAGGRKGFSAPSVTADYGIKQLDADGMVTLIDNGDSEFIAIDPSKGSVLKISNEGGKMMLMKG